jgi:hypothetical protein
MSILIDIPTGVAGALGVNTEIAGLILSAFILFGVGIALTLVKKKDQMMTIIVMLTTMGALTAILWLPIWILVVAVVMIAAMFGSKVMGWIN